MSWAIFTISMMVVLPIAARQAYKTQEVLFFPVNKNGIIIVSRQLVSRMENKTLTKIESVVSKHYILFI